MATGFHKNMQSESTWLEASCMTTRLKTLIIIKVKSEKYSAKHN